MLHPIDKWNVRLGNALDVDLKITRSKNVQSKYVLMKNVIMHATTTETNSDCKIYASMERMSSNDKWKNHGNTEN